ncbi:hypothetical protein DL991_18545 [Amycolatopsis sp. WAC 01375]|uniref:hypothetical protein n=1 Tax=Amycolatopsis sp. WAC 01375 TaxID=2203194 RepID=UPI001002D744|nr:hypothetical protein [Amycolatopsis sp. WAC 01375]RSM78086.1 hypothetical protein DL991_18545 [Amycolatopsis sp. WAC 01375]RSN28409.1 hypothetical protein DL990_27455 [Amycolatopsis sp. WAC 01416]
MPRFSHLPALVAATTLVLLSQMFATGAVAAASDYRSIDVGPVSMATSMDCWGERKSVGDAWVTLDGDYVTVRDHCDDGNPVMARVQMTVDGTERHWMCYNHSGAGTTQVCGHDWPEGYVGFKTLIFFAWDGIREYKMGTLRHWRDG